MLKENSNKKAEFESKVNKLCGYERYCMRMEYFSSKAKEIIFDQENLQVWFILEDSRVLYSFDVDGCFCPIYWE